jgi:predicted  nucleic acid-binding Zn-ribbon protein
LNNKLAQIKKGKVRKATKRELISIQKELPLIEDRANLTRTQLQEAKNKKQELRDKVDLLTESVWAIQDNIEEYSNPKTLSKHLDILKEEQEKFSSKLDSVNEKISTFEKILQFIYDKINSLKKIFSATKRNVSELKDSDVSLIEIQDQLEKYLNEGNVKLDEVEQLETYQKELQTELSSITRGVKRMETILGEFMSLVKEDASALENTISSTEETEQTTQIETQRKTTPETTAPLQESEELTQEETTPPETEFGETTSSPVTTKGKTVEPESDFKSRANKNLDTFIKDLDDTSFGFPVESTKLTEKEVPRLSDKAYESGRNLLLDFFNNGYFKFSDIINSIPEESKAKITNKVFEALKVVYAGIYVSGDKAIASKMDANVREYRLSDFLETKTDEELQNTSDIFTKSDAPDVQWDNANQTAIPQYDENGALIPNRGGVIKGNFVSTNKRPYLSPDNYKDGDTIYFVPAYEQFEGLTEVSKSDTELPIMILTERMYQDWKDSPQGNRVLPEKTFSVPSAATVSKNFNRDITTAKSKGKINQVKTLERKKEKALGELKKLRKEFLDNPNLVKVGKVNQKRSKKSFNPQRGETIRDTKRNFSKEPISVKTYWLEALEAGQASFEVRLHGNKVKNLQTGEERDSTGLQKGSVTLRVQATEGFPISNPLQDNIIGEALSGEQRDGLKRLVYTSIEKYLLGNLKGTNNKKITKVDVLREELRKFLSFSDKRPTTQSSATDSFSVQEIKNKDLANIQSEFGTEGLKKVLKITLPSGNSKYPFKTYFIGITKENKIRYFSRGAKKEIVAKDYMQQISKSVDMAHFNINRNFLEGNAYKQPISYLVGVKTEDGNYDVVTKTEDSYLTFWDTFNGVKTDISPFKDETSGAIVGTHSPVISYIVGELESINGTKKEQQEDSPKPDTEKEKKPKKKRRRKSSVNIPTKGDALGFPVIDYSTTTLSKYYINNISQTQNITDALLSETLRTITEFNDLVDKLNNQEELTETEQFFKEDLEEFYPVLAERLNTETAILTFNEAFKVASDYVIENSPKLEEYITETEEFLGFEKLVQRAYNKLKFDVKVLLDEDFDAILEKRWDDKSNFSLDPEKSASARVRRLLYFTPKLDKNGDVIYKNGFIQYYNYQSVFNALLYQAADRPIDTIIDSIQRLAETTDNPMWKSITKTLNKEFSKNI